MSAHNGTSRQSMDQIAKLQGEIAHLNSVIAATDARLADAEAMAEALRFVADQAITDEIPARDREAMPRMSKAWNDGYDAAVLRARAALAKWEAGK